MTQPTENHTGDQDGVDRSTDEGSAGSVGQQPSTVVDERVAGAEIVGESMRGVEADGASGRAELAPATGEVDESGSHLTAAGDGRARGGGAVGVVDGVPVDDASRAGDGGADAAAAGAADRAGEREESGEEPGDEVGLGDGEAAVDEELAPTDREAAAGGRGGRRRALEREGEVAADFLETLLDIADLDGDIDLDIDGDRAAVAIVDSDEGRVPRRLVGPDGKVLESLQELTRLAVQSVTGERSRLMLDVAGFRADRRAALVTIAQSAIAECKATGAEVNLDPMTAFERKVVHDEVLAAGLASQSSGVEPRRYVVVSPA